MIREIVLDTETTGFEPSEGHRIVEIGCIELVNHLATGEHFHVYLDPERDMPEEAARVHGLTMDFLAGKPKFHEKAQAFLDFIQDSTLVIHNAEFDMRFLNAELIAAGFEALPMARALDTLPMARRKFPGSPASLDALCRRFEVDYSNRALHGALLDSELLAEVYLHLIGGRQPELMAALAGEADKSTAKTSQPENADLSALVNPNRQVRPPRAFPASPEELAAHRAFLGELKDPIWLKLWGERAKGDSH
jgi:DNA polymerase-3 subunit epsilon